MISLRIGNRYIDLSLDTKIRMQLTNPLLSDSVSGGEYTFPFKIPSTGPNLITLSLEGLINYQGVMTQSINGVMLYVDGYMQHVGVLDIYYQGYDEIDVNLRVNTSKLATIAKKKLKELGGWPEISIKSVKQYVHYNVDNSYIGNTLELRYGEAGGDIEFFDVDTTVFDALTDVAAWVNSNLYYGQYAIQATVIGTNEIKFEAQWNGVYPRLTVFFQVPSGGSPPTYTVVSIKSQQDVFLEEWVPEMADKAPGKYPLNNYTYFPVRNEKSEIPWGEAFIELYGFYPFFWQNYYDTATEQFSPKVQYEHPDFSGNFGTPTGITPFIFIAYYLDVICLEIGLYATSIFHTDLDLSSVVAWSNQYLKDSRGNYFTDIFNLKDFTPDLTVEEFLQILCDTACSRPIADLINLKMEFFQLKDLISAPAVDWTNKQVEGRRIYTERTKGLSFIYQRDDNDELISDSTEQMEEWDFIGVLDDVADLPSYIAVDGVNTRRFAFVLETESFYKLEYASGTYSWNQITGNNIRPDLPFIGDEEPDREVQLAETLNNLTEVDELTGSTWKTPHCKQPIQSTFYKNNGVPICNLRLLQHHQFQPNADDVNYPMGSSDGKDIDSVVISNYEYSWHGERGYYVKFWKEWIDFLLKCKPVEKLFDLNNNDLMTLSWKKRVYCDGQYYILLDLKPEFPLTKPTLCRLLKIEK